MELYRTKDPDTRLGRIARWAGLVLLAAVVTGVIVVAFLLRPYAVVAWKVIFGQFVVSIRHAIGVM